MTILTNYRETKTEVTVSDRKRWPFSPPQKKMPKGSYCVNVRGALTGHLNAVCKSSTLTNANK